MSDSGHGGGANTVLVWVSIVGIALTHAKTCVDDDRENTTTAAEVAQHKGRIEALERERMAAGRIEERLDGLIRAFEKFEDNTTRSLEELRKEKRK